MLKSDRIRVANLRGADVYQANLSGAIPPGSEDYDVGRCEFVPDPCLAMADHAGLDLGALRVCSNSALLRGSLWQRFNNINLDRASRISERSLHSSNPDMFSVSH